MVDVICNKNNILRNIRIQFLQYSCTQMNKVNLLAVLVITFAAGTMMTFSTFAYATHDACSFEPTANGATWDEVWNMLCHLELRISSLESQLSTIQLLVSSTGAGIYCPNLPDGADMQRADLGLANLSACDLSKVNFDHASFRYANLQNANLGNTILEGADLTGANLRGANLSGADLTRADLTRADLTGADLTGAKLIDTNLNCLNNSICTTL